MITLKEFISRANAQITAGRILIGERAERREIGNIQDGTFMLNEEGHKILAAIEAGDPKPVKPKAPRRKPTDLAGKTQKDLIEDIDSLDLEI